MTGALWNKADEPEILLQAKLEGWSPPARFAVSPEDRARMQAAAERAAAEGEDTEIGSDPSRIADTTDDAGRRALRRGVREVRAESQEVIGIREQYAKADELLKDPKAAEDLYARIQKGENLQAHEQVAFDKIRANKSLGYLADPTQENLSDAALYEIAYQDMRRDTARALGVIRDALGRVRNGRELLADFVFDLSPDIKLRIDRLKKQRTKAVEATRIAEIDTSIARLLRIEKRRVAKARKALNAAGFDTRLITTDYFKEPATMARIARIIHTSKSPAWEWYKEFIISSMLSGTGTQVVNTTGNIVNSVLEHHLNRVAASMVNTVVRSPDAPTWAENVAFYKAWGAGMVQAANAFTQSLRADMPVFEIDLRKRGISKSEGAKLDIGRASIPGTAGRVIRAPLSLIMAIDEAARAVAFTTEGTALAFRAAKKEGATGDELARRTLEILHGPVREDVHGAALSKANELTFHDPDGKIAKKVLEFRKDLDTIAGTERTGFFPLGTHIAPFISFAAKSFKMGLGLPLHPAFTLVRSLQRFTGNGPYKGSKVNFVNDAARSVVSLMVWWGILQLAADKDEDTGLPRITGPSRDGEWAQDYRTAPPMSIRFNGKWYDYGRLDPLSTTVGTMINALRTADEKGDIMAGVAEVMRTIPAMAEDKTFLQTYGNIHRAVMEPNQERWSDKAQRLARDTFLGPMVPNIVKSTARSTDPYVHASASRPDGDNGSWSAFTRDFDYFVFPAGVTAPPIKHDLWGRPVKRAGESFVERMISPMKTTGIVEDTSQLDLLIVKFNDRFERGEITDPDARRFVPRPPDYSYTTREGERRYFTDAQYERLTREAGQAAAERLKGANLNFETPGWQDIEQIKRVISQARSRVKAAVLRESQDERMSSR